MNAVRLAFGTLSVVPVPPPAAVDRRVAGWAMTMAPLVAAVLALPLWGLSELMDTTWSALVLGVLWVGGLAVLTRAMHLDGLADTADGLGSAKPAATALEVMRKSDVGPFGVATLVLVLVLQVATAAQLLAGQPDGPAYVAFAVVLSRVVLPLACTQPAARADGLGVVVAGSVSRPQVVAAAVLPALPAVVEPSLLLGYAGLLVGIAFVGWCVHRLGGITGDVLGAGVEVTFTATLLALTLA